MKMYIHAHVCIYVFFYFNIYVCVCAYIGICKSVCDVPANARCACKRKKLVVLTNSSPDKFDVNHGFSC